MLKSLLTFFKILLHNESNFDIKKIDADNYFVWAKNGLNAEITINDRVMFVKAWSTVDYVAFYYCTPMISTVELVDDFVIRNVQNSIIFALPKKELSEYFGTHSSFFNQFSTSDFPILFLGRSATRDPDDDGYVYDFVRLNSVRHPIIYFTKKKVIKNVFKYHLNAVNRPDKTIVKNIAYYVDDVLIYLSDLASFYKNNTTHERNRIMDFGWMVNSNYNHEEYARKVSIGFQNQLFEHHEAGTKHLNLDKIRLLKMKKEQFCLIGFNKKQLMISYIEHLNVNGNISGNLTTLRYSKGRLIKHIKPIDLDVVQQHEMDISTSVMSHLDTFKLTHPSDDIINRLNTLQIPTNLPLNPDDLLVLDMYQV